MNRIVFFRWLKVVLLLYGAIGIAFYYLQEKVLFRPEVVSSTQPWGFAQPHQEVNLMVTPTSNLNLVQFKHTGDSLKGVVLYFHGNRKNVSWYAPYTKIFTDQGYEVWMMDYPGYGKSTGIFTEKTIYEWALLVYKLARPRFSPQQIILYGKSMGTGVASQLASVRDCKRLILETPYYDLPNVLRPYLSIYPLHRIMHYHFPTWQYLQKVTAPVTILHGTSDWTVRYSNTQKLKPFLKKGDTVITVNGGSHNDLFKFPEVTSAIETDLKK